MLVDFCKDQEIIARGWGRWTQKKAKIEKRRDKVRKGMEKWNQEQKWYKNHELSFTMLLQTARKVELTVAPTRTPTLALYVTAV